MSKQSNKSAGSFIQSVYKYYNIVETHIWNEVIPRTVCKCILILMNVNIIARRKIYYAKQTSCSSHNYYFNMMRGKRRRAMMSETPGGKATIKQRKYERAKTRRHMKTRWGQSTHSKYAPNSWILCLNYHALPRVPSVGTAAGECYRSQLQSGECILCNILKLMLFLYRDALSFENFVLFAPVLQSTCLRLLWSCQLGFITSFVRCK